MFRLNDLTVYRPLLIHVDTGVINASEVTAQVTVPTGRIWELTAVGIFANGTGTSTTDIRCRVNHPSIGTGWVAALQANPIPSNSVLNVGATLWLSAGYTLLGSWYGAAATNKRVRMTATGREYLI